MTAVGGKQSGNSTNSFLSFKKEGGKWKWMELFPPMPTKRSFTAIVCSGRALVVAGGEGNTGNSRSDGHRYFKMVHS